MVNYQLWSVFFSSSIYSAKWVILFSKKGEKREFTRRRAIYNYSKVEICLKNYGVNDLNTKLKLTHKRDYSPNE